MRLAGSLLGAAAATLMIMVSAGMNIAFLSSFGRSQTESLILGLASGAADILKALLPFFIVWAWRSGKRGFLIPASLVWALFAGFSLLSAFGFAAGNRLESVEAQAALNDRLLALDAERAQIIKRLNAMPPGRAIGAVEAEIRAARQHLRWSSTRGCSDASVPESRAFCAGYFSLRSALASARQEQDLQAQRVQLSRQIEALKSQGGGRGADPQSALLAAIIGTDDTSVRLALIIVLAVVVELGSSLGLYLATAHSPLSQGRKTGPEIHKTVEPDKLEVKPVGEVLDYCLDRLIPVPGQVLGWDDLREDYLRWCGHCDLEALEPGAFEAEFRVIAERIDLDLTSGGISHIGLADGDARLQLTA